MSIPTLPKTTFAGYLKNFWEYYPAKGPLLLATLRKFLRTLQDIFENTTLSKTTIVGYIKNNFKNSAKTNPVQDNYCWLH